MRWCTFDAVVLVYWVTGQIRRFAAYMIAGCMSVVRIRLYGCVGA